MKLLITKLIKTGKETNMYDSTWGSCFKHIVYSGSKVVCFPNIKRLRLRTMAEKPLMKITSVYKFTRYILRLRMETQPSDYMTNNAQHKNKSNILYLDEKWPSNPCTFWPHQQQSDLLYLHYFGSRLSLSDVLKTAGLRDTVKNVNLFPKLSRTTSRQREPNLFKTSLCLHRIFLFVNKMYRPHC